MSNHGCARVGAVVALLVALMTGCASGSDVASGAPTSTTGSTIPARSAGCGHPTAPVVASDVTIQVNGTQRSYLLDVPAMATAGRPAPLVIDMHGLAEGAEFHRRASAFATLGDSKGFITVTPQGQGSGATTFFDARPGSTDIAFVRAILDDVEAKQCIDPTRVYAAGYSNGAFLSSTLACVMADRFAAVAPVAGVRDIPGCRPSRRVPVIAFHGTADQFVLYDGGVSQVAAKLAAPPEWTGPRDLPGIDAVVPGPINESIPKVVDAWAHRNHCAPGPHDTAVASDVTLIGYHCPKGAEVELYRIEGGGHTWPGSAATATLASVLGPTTLSIDATALIWTFFSSHTLPTR
jgi:polyhydroxybutyrate depolymerase